MAERVRRNKSEGGNYFAAPKDIPFISSGCTLLDCALGGGWAEGRVSNIVGDKSTGKTLLCIEAAANFDLKYPNKGRIIYREAEAAFDQSYAEALGMPVSRVEFGDGKGPIETVEDFFEDLEKITKAKNREPVLYILDSLDALSDREELTRDMDKGTYGAAKAKVLSQLFRRTIRKVEDAGVTLMIVSQIRDKMNTIGFGEKTQRSGGHALDFYASQVLRLAHMKTLNSTVKGVKRATGVLVKGKVSKNKVGLPFREAQFEITFGYGIEDEQASVEWLKEIGVPEKEYRELKGEALRNFVEQQWWRIEQSFLPKKKKYTR